RHADQAHDELHAKYPCCEKEMQPYPVVPRGLLMSDFGVRLYGAGQHPHRFMSQIYTTGSK
ncbi:MAG: hypothetical protein ACTH5V_21790, partial [Serratia proteamaculans]